LSGAPPGASAMPILNAPKPFTFVLSALLAALAYAGVAIHIPYVTDMAFWLLLLAYLMLMIGTIARGL
jgi:hypothetical protein